MQHTFELEVILVGDGISDRKDIIGKINEELNEVLAPFDTVQLRPGVEACKFREEEKRSDS